VETLKDKILGINARIVENNEKIEQLKIKYTQDVAIIKVENKKYIKLSKKLEDMESSIASLFNEA